MKSQIKTVVINLILAGLCVAVVVTAAKVFYEIYDFKTVNARDEAYLIDNLKYGKYDNLLRDVYRNEAKCVETTETMEECYAVAHYYEAAVYYKAYLTAGETEKAEEKKAVMEEQKEMAEILSYAIEEINIRLGLTFY